MMTPLVPANVRIILNYMNARLGDQVPYVIIRPIPEVMAWKSEELVPAGQAESVCEFISDHFGRQRWPSLS